MSTWQLGMGDVRLGRDDDIGSILGRFQADGFADAARRAGDKQRLSGQPAGVRYRHD